LALTPGARLGPYELTGQIGAGGMGEVYKARDTRLDRTVAIKVLPADVSQDADLRARFEREARAIAALDHPHICALHDVGEHEGTLYLVMQHLEGETLAARLARANGPLPLDQALKIAIEIADALDKAHRAGMTHRDLKPANIMLTKAGAKLLDFGLAKLHGPAAAISMSGMTRLATATPNTARGTILGTVHYMAPEQVEGREADARSDIWALGVVLYEVLTGTRPFTGESPASIIGSILKDTPPALAVRQPQAPPALDHIVARCLEKDPDERWQSAADLGRELRWVATPPGAATAATLVPKRRVGWSISSAAAGLAAGVIIATAATVTMPRSVPTDRAAVMKFEINPPPHTVFASPQATLPAPQLALSPDGKWLAFVARGIGSDAMLWLRPIDGAAATTMSGTEEASFPFWSPDSRSLGFFAQGKLKRIEVRTGAPQILCDAIDSRGGAWSRDNVIAFGLNQTGLWRVPASGGEPVRVTSLASSETGHRWPSFLPDGQHLLFVARTVRADNGSVNVVAIDGSDRRRLLASQFGATYANGYIFSLTDSTLSAQPFDLRRRVLVGEPTPVAEHVAGSTVLYGSYSVSETGLLAYATDTTTEMQLAWFARDGRLENMVGPPRDYADVQLMPGGRRALVTRPDAKTSSANIWSIDVKTGDSFPITFDASIAAQPVVSPDGRELVFRSSRQIPAPIFRRLTSGSGSDEVLLAPTKVGPRDTGNLFPTDWSSDGRFILFHAAYADTNYDLFVLPMTGDRTPRPFVQTRGADLHGRFSPDGRWVAYSSAESGRHQIYVQPFPNADGRWQVSTEGGAEPRWRGDGRELYFIGADRRMMAVPVTTAASFEHGTPQPLFPTRVSDMANPYRTSYAVTPDGQHFLINSVAENATAPSLTVVTNWPGVLKR
jgi:serine/threonine protein kinase